MCDVIYEWHYILFSPWRKVLITTRGLVSWAARTRCQFHQHFTCKQLFWKEVFCEVFLYLLFVFVLFWQKYTGKKDAHNMLVKLTTGVNFINMLTSSFYTWRSQKRKKIVKSLVEKRLTNLLCYRTLAYLHFTLCAQVWWNWLQQDDESKEMALIKEVKSVHGKLIDELVRKVKLFF